MSAPPYHLLFTGEAEKVLEDLENSTSYRAKRKKVAKALQKLRDAGPGYPALQSHKYESMRGLDGEDVWESYVENRTPGAWRIWWYYGPRADAITILTIGPHPD
ncbi:hypothetical protein [Salinifilum ghardaiensis]